MKIGILQTAYKKSKDYGAFYNVQELGLGRALASLGHTVVLYKGVDGESAERTECNGNLTIKLISLNYIGINGLINPQILDKTLDVLIYFCDTQIRMPSVYRWCVKNDIRFYPYIGVVDSHSENSIKRMLMKLVALRNVNIYKQCTVFAKTPNIASQLLSLGCQKTTLLPVGLDESVMKVTSSSEIRNISEIDSLLFIGRMEEEKHPHEMLYIYEQLLSINPTLRLTMIGDGYLYEDIRQKAAEIISKHALSDNQLSLIQKVRYENISEYYLSHSCYVNLNRVEILGMSILESMYYGCPAFVIKAPGPCFIMDEQNNENNKYGFIASDTNQIINYISMFIKKTPTTTMSSANTLNDIAANAHQRISQNFLWSSIVNELEL